MAGVAIGHRDKFHVVAQGRELGRGAGGADVAIIGVRAKSDHAELAIRTLRGKRSGAEQ